MDSFNPNVLDFFILKVQEKVIYKNLDREVISGFLFDVLKRFEKEYFELERKFVSLRKKEQILSNKFFKLILKELKKSLHNNYGVFFLKNQSFVLKFLDSYEKSLDDKFVLEILKLHTSTSERLDFYDKVYENLSLILDLNEVDFVCDLACGYNPIKFADFFKNSNFFYFFADLNVLDIQNVSRIFKVKGVSSFGFDCNLVYQKSFLLDVLNNQIKRRSARDVLCVLFKALDSFENLQRNFSLNLIKDLVLIGVNSFLVSFPTKTIGGRVDILEQKRSWFLNFLTKNTQFKFDLKFFEVENEVFYFFKVL